MKTDTTQPRPPLENTNGNEPASINQHMANVNAVTEHMLNLPPKERAAFARSVLDMAKVHDIGKKL